MSAPLPAEAAAAPAGATVGHFVCVAKLGAGGGGEVHRAWDRDLGRWVALKLLKGSSDQDLARFAREARAAARLDHPNIARVYEVGAEGGRNYIAMQLIAGRTLREECIPIDPRRVVTLVRDAACAVAFAHAGGVIHRDLKPENIMVEGDRVFVMDFGLARTSAGESSISHSGLMIGTPSYMPPEQARGELDRSDARSDVYSLGATLYDLLAGRPPFAGELFDVLQAVCEQDPPAPSRINPAVEPELDAVVLKCMEKEPERRYASAAELAEELDRWLRGESVLARPASLARIAARRMSRSKAAWMAGGSFAIVAVGVALALVAVSRGERSKAEREAADRMASETRRAAMQEVGALWARASSVREWRRQSFRKPAEIRAELVGIVAAADSLVERRPELAQAWLVRARARLDLGDAREAESDALRATELERACGPAWALLGQSRIELYFRALDQGRLVADDPRQRILERAGEAMRRWRAAEAGGWGLPPSADDDVTATLAAAMHRRMIDGDTNGALLMLRTAHDRRPSEVFARYLGNWSVDRGEKLRRAEEALAIAPWYLEGLFDRANCRRALGDSTAAKADLERALELNPSHAAVHNNLGTNLWRLGQYAGAIAEYTRAIELTPDAAFYWGNRSVSRSALGDDEGAIRDASKAIEISPGHTAGWINRGAALHNTGRDAEALLDFDKAMAIDPADPDVHAYRGGCRLNLKDLEGARRDLDAAIRLQADHAQALCSRSRLRLTLGDLDGALEDVERALAAEPSSSILHVQRAQVRFQRGETRLALDDADAAVKICPTIKGGFSTRAVVRLTLGDYDGAIADAGEAIRQQPSDVTGWVNRSGAKLGKNDFVGAVEDATKALSLNSREAMAWSNRAAGRLHLGDFDGALADGDRAVELGPGQWTGWYQRGRAKFERGDLDGAVADLTRAIELGRSRSEPWNIRGAAKMRKGDYRGVVEDCTKAIELDARCEGAWANRGLARLNLRDPKGAIEDCTASIQLNPKQPYVWTVRGCARLRTGNLPGAIEDCTAALERNPRDDWAFAIRCTAKARSGDPAGGAKDGEQAVAINPKDAGSWYSLGEARVREGEPAKAAAALTRAVELSPASHEYRFARAQARAKSGDRGGAFEDAEKALELAPAGWSNRAAAEALRDAMRGP